MQKLIISTVIILTFLACDNLRNGRSKVSAQISLEHVNFYGDHIYFDPPKVVNVIPNSQEITLIELNNGVEFGLKYFLTSISTEPESEFSHNVVFYEKDGAEWQNMNSEEHREELAPNKEKYWGIGASSNGEQYFKVDFKYLLSI